MHEPQPESSYQTGNDSYQTGNDLLHNRFLDADLQNSVNRRNEFVREIIRQHITQQYHNDCFRATEKIFVETSY
jgi:hypothetical protein